MRGRARAPLLQYAVSGDRMCLAPLRLKDGSRVACRHCEVCRENRVSDWVGRSVAEAQVCVRSFAVTLTYAGDVPNAAVLCNSDIQAFIRAIRDDGHKVRYLVAGEYGATKGRAHWHCILFLYSDLPVPPLETRSNWKYWPHGFVYFQNPDPSGFRYVLKYILKDMNVRGGTKSLLMSKKPPIGYQFFMDLADRYALNGLAIQSPEYSFINITDRKGQIKKFWLQGKMRQLYLERYISTWTDINGCPPRLFSDWVTERYLDPIAKKERELDPYLIERDLKVRDAALAARQKADADAYRASTRHALALLVLDGGDYAEAYSDQTVLLNLGGKPWQAGGVNANVETLERQLRLCGLSERFVPKVARWSVAQWLRFAGTLPPHLRLSAP